MEKDLEITFMTNQKDDGEIVEALANLVGNEFLDVIRLDWRIFHVTIGRDRFYKVCFVGPKMTKLHPVMEERVRKRFDDLSHQERERLLATYHDKEKEDKFVRKRTENKYEEYDLWQDNFWQYL